MSLNYNDLNQFFSESPWFAWLTVVVASIILSGFIKLVLRFLSPRLRKYAERTQARWDNLGLDIVDGLRKWVLFLWVFFVLSKSLEQDDGWKRTILFITVLASSYQFAVWGLYLIRSWKQNVLDKRIAADPAVSSAVGLVYTTVQIFFLVVLTLIAMSNLGINISALIAGLGVGGIAVALAAQNILGDLFASLSIVLDKPFQVGDFIVTGKERGTVEQIGVKTTRLRALSGEELIFSNKDLLESRIQNFKGLFERRVVVNFGVTYSTSIEKLKQIPVWVQEFVRANQKLRFDRCHFSKYGNSSLDFELVFYVLDSDYNKFMDLQQDLLLVIFQKFAAENIDFAFPTQTLYVEKLPLHSN